MQDATRFGDEAGTGTVRFQVEEPAGRRTVPVAQLPFSIGRRSANDLVLMDPQVSRDHAEVVAEGPDFVLNDRGSRFGTFVNGERVSRHRLSFKDRVTFGASSQTELVFLPADGDATVAPTGKLGGDLNQIASVLEALRGLGSNRVLDEVLTLVLDSAIDVTGAERGFIMLAGANGTLEMKLVRAQGKITLPMRDFAISRKIPEEVFATGKRKIVTDMLDSGPMVEHQGTVALGIRHVLCAPLRLVRVIDRAENVAAPDTIGVLYLDSRERGTLVSGNAGAALDALAGEAASAIENARLYREALQKAHLDQELRTAAHIQQALLPPPRKKGAFFDAMGTSLPCRAIGGDFLEYFDSPGGGFAFALGDVAGKGPPAALLAAILQGILTGQAYSDAPPATVVARLNTALLTRRVESRFATVFYGHLSPDGLLTYCNAGHNPPLLVGASETRRLEAGGTIVGLFPEATYEQETLQLSPGDVLVVYSDGVSEAVNTAGDEFGEDRIREVVAAARANPADDIQRELLRHVREFAHGAPQTDDITALVISYNPPAE